MRMKLFSGIKSANAFIDGTVATIGNFDGVHLGHQALLTQLRLEADKRNLPLVVVLFEPQPAEFFQGNKAPNRLSTLREKIHYLKQCKVDYIYCMRFNNKLAMTSAMDFANRLLSLLNVRYLLLGEDFRFGRGREGNIDLLRVLAHEKKCSIEVFPTFVVDNMRVSSTKVRQLLAENRFWEAERLCGRPYYLCGRAKTNLRTHSVQMTLMRRSLPFSGLFCIKLQRANGQSFNGMVDIGHLDGREMTRQQISIDVLDLDEELNGELLQVHFLNKLRDAVTFATKEQQRTQHLNDIAGAKFFFAPDNLELNLITE